MAYREFYRPLPPLPPVDLSPIREGFQNFMGALANVQAQKQARQRAANQYQATLEYGENENDNLIVQKQAIALTQMGQEDILRTGGITGRTLAREQQLLREAADRKAQYAMLKEGKQYIDSQDEFYNKAEAEQDWKTAYLGPTGDANWMNRKPEMDRTWSKIHKGSHYFMIDKFTQKYTKDLLDNERSTKFTSDGDKGTSTSGNTVTAPFMDPLTGQFQITDKDVQRYMGSHKDVEPKINELVEKDLMEDVVRIKSLDKNDPRKSWATDNMSPREMLLHIIEKPEDNPFAVTKKDPSGGEVPKSFNDLKFDKARNIIETNMEVQKKVSSEFKPSEGPAINDANRLGQIKNPKIVTDVTTFPNGDGATAPGAVLRTNEGKSIPVPISGMKDFHIVGHQAVLKNKNGENVPIPGYNLRDQINAIERMPDDEVAKYGAQMIVGVRGYTIDKAQQLEEIEKFRNKLNDELIDAVNSGDKLKQQDVQSKIDRIEDYRVGLSNKTSDLNTLMSMAAQAGFNANIKDTQTLDTDEVYTVIKTLTSDKGKGGLDLRNKSHWTPDEVAVANAWDKRYAKFVGNYSVSPNKKTATKVKEEPKKEEPKAKLNPGEIKVIGPDGKSYAIPADQKDEAIKQGYKVVD